MPPYCIVCNRDLATDPTAEPPRCSLHAAEHHVQEDLNQQQQRFKYLLPTLVTCRVELHSSFHAIWWNSVAKEADTLTGPSA